MLNSAPIAGSRMDTGENVKTDFYNGCVDWRSTHMKQLEKGKLYQVYVKSLGWVIAEYSNFVDTHIANGWSPRRNASSWREPAAHYWKQVPSGNTLRVYDKGMQVRPLAEDTLAEIERMKATIKTKQQELNQVINELRELCS